MKSKGPRLEFPAMPTPDRVDICVIVPEVEAQDAELSTQNSPDEILVREEDRNICYPWFLLVEMSLDAVRPGLRFFLAFAR